MFISVLKDTIVQSKHKLQPGLVTLNFRPESGSGLYLQPGACIGHVLHVRCRLKHWVTCVVDLNDVWLKCRPPMWTWRPRWRPLVAASRTIFTVSRASLLRRQNFRPTIHNSWARSLAMRCCFDQGTRVILFRHFPTQVYLVKPPLNGSSK